VNAIDATEGKPDRRVTVKVDCRNATASRNITADTTDFTITVEDNGAGIDEADFDRIFSLFESTKGSRGTGLGLPVTQKIIREHGGELKVASTLGEGATFTIHLPSTPITQTITPENG
jgi:signal transduction histidine kinase